MYIHPELRFLNNVLTHCACVISMIQFIVQIISTTNTLPEDPQSRMEGLLQGASKRTNKENIGTSCYSTQNRILGLYMFVFVCNKSATLG